MNERTQLSLQLTEAVSCIHLPHAVLLVTAVKTVPPVIHIDGDDDSDDSSEVQQLAAETESPQMRDAPVCCQSDIHISMSSVMVHNWYLCDVFKALCIFKVRFFHSKLISR